MNAQEIIEKYIAVRPNVQQGKPCIRNTRIPVHVILESLALGMTKEEIQKEYAPITPEAIQACILYGALLASDEELTRLSA